MSVIKIALTKLVDLIYLYLALMGIILVGAFYLVPKVVHEEAALYKTVGNIVEMNPSDPKEVVARIRAGELVILHLEGLDWEDTYKELLENAGVSKKVYLGICRAEGCVISFVINNKDVIDCIVNHSDIAYVRRTVNYIGGVKHLLMFNKTGSDILITDCLLDNPLIVSDVKYNASLKRNLIIREKNKESKVIMIFSDKGYEVSFLVKPGGEVRVV